jgi:hypothetical protein
MTDRSLKNRLGVAIFLGQLSLVAMVLLSPFYGVDFPDAMSLLTVVAPILGAYAVVIVRHFTETRFSVRTKGKQITKTFAVITIAAPVALYTLTVTVFMAYALGWWNVSVENTRFTLTTLEALFGVYLGVIVDALFKSAKSLHEPTE